MQMFVVILSHTDGVTQTKDTSAYVSKVETDSFLQPWSYVLYVLSFLLF